MPILKINRKKFRFYLDVTFFMPYFETSNNNLTIKEMATSKITSEKVEAIIAKTFGSIEASKMVEAKFEQAIRVKPSATVAKVAKTVIAFYCLTDSY